MKLTLEQLAPYLPYSLEAMVKCDGQEYKASVTGFYHFGTELHIECKNGSPGLYRFNTEEEYVKPILRPLSDLTAIDDGYTNEHSINQLISEKYNIEYGIFSQYKNDLTIELDGDPNLRYEPNRVIDFYIILDIQKELLKAYYDIFGLIEKGLAININEL